MSVVKLAELEGAKRIDADRYHPEYLKLKREMVGIFSIKKLRSLLFKPVRTGHTPKNRDIFPADEKISFIKTDTLREGVIDFENCDFLPSKCLSRIHYLEDKEVIVTIIGAHFGIVGRAAIFLNKYSKSVVNQNIAVIRVDENILDPFYFMIFLNCEYGRKQLWMLSRQTEQVNLNCREVEKILIPLFTSNLQNKIRDVSRVSLSLLEASKSLYLQAENLLLEELGIKDFKPKYELSYTANLSDAFGVHRVDAEYFQPAYETLMKKLKERIELSPLRKFILSVQKGIEVGSEKYEEEGKPFIRVSNLSISGFTDRDQKYIGEKLYQQLKTIYEPKEGDFLLTKDATPGIAYVVKEPVEGIISSGILKLKINDNEINKEYLALCINSLVGKMQIERDGGGSVIIHWKPEQVKKLKIPILPPKTQQKIASLVQQSHEARKKAKELLEKAKRAVEIAVEEGE